MGGEGVALDVTLGEEHTCAVLADGSIRCWGNGALGNLGQNNPMADACVKDGYLYDCSHGASCCIGDDELPTAGLALSLAGASAVQLASGWSHTCALSTSGDVWCWGSALYGRLGYGDIPDGTFFCLVEHQMSGYYLCERGPLCCVGDDEWPHPAGPVKLGGKALQLAAGSEFTCALMDDGGVRCWGEGLFGQLGFGEMATIGDDEAPVDGKPVALGAAALSVAAGAGHSCAILEGGAVRCWGSGSFGTLGQPLGFGVDATIGDDELPTAIDPVSLSGPATQVTAGWGFSCALIEGGDVRCWGYGEHGVLGRGDTPDSLCGYVYEPYECELDPACCIGDDELPSDVPPVDLGAPALQIASGHRHSCAVLVGGDVRCWGDNEEGQLGYGHTENIGDDEPPSAAGPVDLGGEEAVRVAAGAHHSCAIMKSGALRCWGAGASGELGYGVTDAIGDEPGEMPPPPVALE